MPIKSRFSTSVPLVSLQTWLFGSPDGPLPNDNKALVDADNPDEAYMSTAEYRLWSKRIALGLQRAGLHPGDRVLLLSGNHLLFPAFMMGIIMAGGIFTGASPAFTPGEVAYQLGDARPTFVVAAQMFIPTAVKAADLVGMARSRILSFDNVPSRPSQPNEAHVGHWTDILASEEDASTYRWFEPQDPRTTTCALNYSSGTTGKPKGVEISHYSYVANGEAVISQNDFSWRHNPAVMDSSVICFLPLYHAAAQTGYVVNFPKLQKTVYIMAAYDFEKMLKLIQKYKISRLGAAPPVVLHLAKSPLTKQYDLSSIHDITCGTALLQKEVADEALTKLSKGAGIFQAWGMTELTCMGTFSHPENNDIAAVGEVATNATVKIMDGDREITEANKPGELWLSGPTVMKGYWCKPEATDETIVVDENGDRWVKTGDLALVDKYGPGARIFIVDRVKDLIKVRGFQVAPAELEGILLDRKDIVDASVVGVTIGGDEVPRAYVVKNSDVTEKELADWLAPKVAKYKWLRGGVAFVDAIPRLPSGKVLRKELRLRAQEEVGDKKKSGPQANL